MTYQGSSSLLFLSNICDINTVVKKKVHFPVLVRFYENVQHNQVCFLKGKDIICKIYFF